MKGGANMTLEKAQEMHKKGINIIHDGDNRTIFISKLTKIKNPSAKGLFRN